MSSPKLITTSDGSHSLFNEDLNETYHSIHGAIQESRHVFIQSGLAYYLEKFKPQHVSVLEIGFGTGLNALLTIQVAKQSPVSLHYTTLEAFPLNEVVWSQLNYANELNLKNEFDLLHRTSWEQQHPIISNFQLEKKHIKLQDVRFKPASFDIIFFDAFAPSKQPELWGIDMLKKVTDTLRANGVFVTYCAKGQLKRDLKSLGLILETLPGPPGKKEMVRAVKV